MNAQYSQSVQEELAALASKSDADIDFSDIPVATERDWAGAVRGKFYRSETSLNPKPSKVKQHDVLEQA